MSTHTDTAGNQPAGSISGSAPYAIYGERASASLSVAQQVVDLILHRLANGENIRVLGLTGPPGTGKTTVAALVAEILETADVAVAGIAPMDGFHMSNAVLDDLERHDRKGAPDTFDIWGYETLLARIQASEHPVFAPDYNRGLHEPVAASILIPTEGIVITEGNYLAFDEPGWRETRGHIDFLVTLIRRQTLSCDASSPATKHSGNVAQMPPTGCAPWTPPTLSWSPNAHRAPMRSSRPKQESNCGIV